MTSDAGRGPRSDERQGTHLLTSAEAGKLLSLSDRYVRHLAVQGRMSATMVTPWGRLFTREEVERVARERKASAAQAKS